MGRHDSQKGVDRLPGGNEAEGPQIGEGQLQLSPQLCGPPLLAECTRLPGFPHVHVNEGGEGVQTLCLVHHLPHKQGPRVRGLIEGVRAQREGLVLGDGVGGQVGEAADLGQGHFGHCGRN